MDVFEHSRIRVFVVFLTDPNDSQKNLYSVFLILNKPSLDKASDKLHSMSHFVRNNSPVSSSCRFLPSTCIQSESPLSSLLLVKLKGESGHMLKIVPAVSYPRDRPPTDRQRETDESVKKRNSLNHLTEYGVTKM